MNVDRIRNVADARRLAARTLPRVVFDYVDGGSDDEVTMRANEAAFAGVPFRPRMGTDAGSPDLSVTVLGHDLALPVILAPCGLVRAMHPDSAEGAARAAAGRGTLSVLSTVAGAPLERVVPEARGRVWFQLYSAGGRDDAAALCERAARAGVEVLMVTIDTPALGNRERDKQHGVTPPLRLGPRNTLNLGYQVLTKPGWTLRMAKSGLGTLQRPGRRSEPRPPAEAPAAAEEAPGGGATDSGSGSKRMLTMAASPFLWSDVAWLAEQWKGKLVVKGLLSGEDARRAVDSGAHGVVVSNHGGRQLDGAPATLAVLPEVVAAVGDHAEVLFDGGVRRGSHVVTALAMGARAVMIGRPYLYGLAAAGQAGVERVLHLFAEEMSRTMTLLGCSAVSDLGPDWLQAPG
jgi:isopentenyl diphosphate isomerase/L-lactate dehydrogenase-like FMN-dependent dehydrogenase